MQYPSVTSYSQKKADASTTLLFDSAVKWLHLILNYTYNHRTHLTEFRFVRASSVVSPIQSFFFNPSMTLIVIHYTGTFCRGIRIQGSRSSVKHR